MYIPCAVFRRTPLERADQDLAWHRDDQWFFAAGACHILAYAFLETHSHRFTAKGLWPADAADPGHVYVSDGTRAFDHCGWTLERELLAVSRAVEPAANYQSRAIRMGLDELCARHWHRTRAEFLHDPWPRAHAYIARLDSSPPGNFDGGVVVGQSRPWNVIGSEVVGRQP
ncbi:hypothetical protein [Nocardia nepalensis]|uniref:hypothetical protein n=1 Tax=Nocardia nepalensis TaxID=3375448 RepID=UPI003B66E24B